ncbi:hypothetical protein F2981_29710 (plasmid) [Sinorhizobium meliloti]|nr:hypothetical protein [Sinorhizobium meliloti]
MAIARALASEPELIVCDEAVSGARRVDSDAGHRASGRSPPAPRPLHIFITHDLPSCANSPTGSW